MDPEALISSALQTISPRPTFFDELLTALKQTPLLLVPTRDVRAERLRRMRLAGSVVAGAGVVGATTYTIFRRFHRKGAQ